MEVVTGPADRCHFTQLLYVDESVIGKQISIARTNDTMQNIKSSLQEECTTEALHVAAKGEEEESDTSGPACVITRHRTFVRRFDTASALGLLRAQMINYPRCHLMNPRKTSPATGGALSAATDGTLDFAVH